MVLPGLPEKLPHVALPRGVQEAWQLKRSLGERAVYSGGGTLLRTQWENQVQPVPFQLIALDRLKMLRGIHVSDGGMVEVGAMSTLNECIADPLLTRSAPQLIQALRQIAAPAVRNLATLGGNVCSWSGDVLPALLALDAEVSVYAEGKQLRLPLDAWLNTSTRDPHALLCRIYVPPAADGAEDGLSLAMYAKVGRRQAFTASLVTVAVAGRFTKNGTVRGIRIVAGGGGAAAQRLTAAENLLEGGQLSKERLFAVSDAIRNQYQAASDAFAGAEYRAEAAANLVAAHLWQIKDFKAP
ncbi:FAD binding domain-containing protein [Paenibacillus daejeonensis]|uniref:FAD binding domain-containing protein n=1 Tax=Paenibacillus daejeonensis TaxID=135193 RepID=UPI000362470A|nr:FAD binding domain-containing protein [Paenibacillus daejeonensis]